MATILNSVSGSTRRASRRSASTSVSATLTTRSSSVATRIASEYCSPWRKYIPLTDTGSWSQNTITTVMAGGDAHSLPVHDCGPAFESLAAALAKSIKAIDADYTPFMTYHPASCWLPNTPKATSSQFFPEADWLSMDVIQSGHMDGAGLQGGDFGGITAWRAKSSYIPVRLMYEQKTKDGKPRPVMDLEGHYESTPYVRAHWHRLLC